MWEEEDKKKKDEVVLEMSIMLCQYSKCVPSFGSKDSTWLASFPSPSPICQWRNTEWNTKGEDENDDEEEDEEEKKEEDVENLASLLFVSYTRYSRVY